MAAEQALLLTFVAAYITWLWLSSRQNQLDGYFSRSFQLIEQSDDILNRLASLAGLTKEEPHPSCFGSQLVSVHLLEPSFLVFLVSFVAHGAAFTD
jgi:hypothetical protein